MCDLYNTATYRIWLMKYSKQTDFEHKLIDFGRKVGYITAAEMAGKRDANGAYKEIKELFKEVTKLRKKEKGKDHPLDYHRIPSRY